MSNDNGSRRYVIGGGVAACAVCCAPPLLALLGIAGAGLAATIATVVLAGLTFGLVVAALTVIGVMARKRRGTRSTTSSTRT